MRHARLTLALGLAVLTAACGKKGETPVTTETNQAAPAATMSGDMGNMSMAPDANAAIKAKGHGTVTAIDDTAGSATVHFVAADGRALARALRVAGKVDPIFVDGVAELVPAIAEQVRDGDVVIAMGAGSIGTVAQKLKDLLEGAR